MLEDTFESMEDDDLEEIAQEEVDKILFEVTKGENTLYTYSRFSNGCIICMKKTVCFVEKTNERINFQRKKGVLVKVKFPLYSLSLKV